MKDNLHLENPTDRFQKEICQQAEALVDIISSSMDDMNKFIDLHWIHIDGIYLKFTLNPDDNPLLADDFYAMNAIRRAMDSKKCGKNFRLLLNNKLKIYKLYAYKKNLSLIVRPRLWLDDHKFLIFSAIPILIIIITLILTLIL